jgi:hypothetical protein
MKRPLILLFFLSLLTNAWAQKEKLDQDMPFFQHKKADYELFLKNIGLDPFIRLDRVQMRPDRNNPGQIIDTELELILKFRTHDPDTAELQWLKLIKGFDNPADSLSHLMYRTFVHQMEIPAEQGSIQILVDDIYGSRIWGFYIWIWSENGMVRSKLQPYRSKSVQFELNIPAKLRSGNSMQAQNVNIADNPQAIFAKIRRHIETNIQKHPKYQQSIDCQGRVPYFSTSVEPATNTTYQIVLENLCKEVLQDQHRPWLERKLEVNSIAYERLTFSFVYVPAFGQNPASLRCVVDGKYGPGIFRRRSSKYFEMEDGFKNELTSYVTGFKNGLAKLLR